MKALIFTLVISSIAAIYAILLLGIPSPAISTPQYFNPIYTESFETEPHWSMNEEVVTQCYTTSIGTIGLTTSVSFDGSSSFLVWANYTRTQYSNHVIAGKSIAKRGQNGIWRYVAHAYIDPASTNMGQTGPEFSIQNTRNISGTFRTSTAGIQYISNSAAPDHDNWKVWSAVSPTVTDWQTFVTQTIASGVWYTLTLEADYNSNVYRSFALQGGGLDLVYDLSAYQIAQEDKHFTNEDFVITLEAENRWHTCGTLQVFDYKVYYDLITLMQDQKIFLPIILKR